MPSLAEAGYLGHELLSEWPSYLGYVVAFLCVGVIWLNHHYIFERFAKLTSNLTASISHSRAYSFSDRRTL
jgi:uncharacterized membrane protein